MHAEAKACQGFEDSNFACIDLLEVEKMAVAYRRGIYQTKQSLAMLRQASHAVAHGGESLSWT